MNSPEEMARVRILAAIDPDTWSDTWGMMRERNRREISRLIAASVGKQFAQGDPAFFKYADRVHGIDARLEAVLKRRGLA